MTIKKPATGGGATIADRFRLEAPAEKAKPAKGAAAGGTATTIALSAAVLALVLVGYLALTLYRHAEYLLPV